MATSSTRSARKAAAGAAAADAPVTTAPAPAGQTAVGNELSGRAWLVAYYSILAVALALRLAWPELRPMHHDEGVNGHFLLNLMRSGAFRYDPSNYHGPTLYYFTLPLASAAEKFGALSTWVVRLVPVVFGMATVWLGLSLRRYVGAVGALAAGALMAVSPGLVFFSRYFIHEMMFVFFTLGIVVAALRFNEMVVGRERADGDNNSAALGAGNPAAFGAGIVAAAAVLLGVWVWACYGRPDFKITAPLTVLCFLALLALLWLLEGARSIYLALGAVSAGLLFATKETAFISVGVLLIACATTALWMWLVGRAGWGRAPEPKKKKKGRERRPARAVETPESPATGLLERLGGGPRAAILLAAAVGIFLFVNYLYYSSFYTNDKGPAAALEAYVIWKKTGGSGFHGYGWHKYVQWLVGGVSGAQYRQWLSGEGDRPEWEFGEEAPLVLLAALGALLALWKTRRAFPLFAAQWGFGLLAAYSIIAYKTPWLVLSMLVPFALAGGYAIDQLYRRRGSLWRFGTLALLAGCLAVMLVQTYRVNFVHYDDDRYPYVYAHTRRSFLDLIAEAERIAERVGGAEGKQKASFNIAVENQEYWPLPWYLRDWKRIGYVGRVTETNDDMVLIKDSQAAGLEATLGDRYRRVGGVYDLRPGVKLVLYARKELVP